MRIVLCLLLLSVACPPVAQAATTKIVGTITITNAANITGTNIEKVVWNTVTLTWTNAVYTPATQILRGTTVAQDAQRLLAHLASFPLVNVRASGDGISKVILTASNDVALSIALTPSTWGYVTYETIDLGTAKTVVSVPMSAFPFNSATTTATQLIEDLKTYGTTSFLTNSATASNAAVKPIITGTSKGLRSLEAGAGASLTSTATSIVLNVTGEFPIVKATNGIFHVPTNGNLVVSRAASSNAVPSTNLVGEVNLASASILEINAEVSHVWNVTNRLTGNLTLVETNSAAGQELVIRVIGEASGGTDRTVTFIPHLGHLAASLDDYAVALATSLTFTLTNGQAVKIHDRKTRLNGTNVSEVLSRQFKF